MTYDPIDTNDDGVVDADVENQSVSTEEATINSYEAAPQYVSGEGNVTAPSVAVGNQLGVGLQSGARYIARTLLDPGSLGPVSSTSYKTQHFERIVPIHFVPGTTPILMVKGSLSNGVAGESSYLQIKSLNRDFTTEIAMTGDRSVPIYREVYLAGPETQYSTTLDRVELNLKVTDGEANMQQHPKVILAYEVS